MTKLTDNNYMIEVGINRCLYQCEGKYLKLINKNTTYTSIW